MPQDYAGDGTSPSVSSGANRLVPIQQVTPGNPTSIQANGHAFHTDDTVEIEGTGAVDGLAQITVQDANNFVLNGVVTAGPPFTSGGYAIDYQVLPAVELPDAGELVSAATSNPIAQAGQDFQPWAYRRLGKYRLYDTYQRANPNAPTGQPWVTTAWASSVGTVQGAAIVHFAGDNSLVSLDVLKNGTATTFGPAVQVGDLLEFEYECGVWAQGSSATGCVLFFPFVTNSSLAGETDFQAAGKLYDLFLGSNPSWPKMPITLRCQYKVGLVGSISVGVAMQMDQNNAGSINCDARLVGPAQVTVRHYRPN